MNEYSDCGAEGSTACEFEEAEDKGKLLCSVVSLSFCFCRDRKLCLVFSLSAPVIVVGTRVEVDALADEYKEDALDILGSTRLVVELLKVELLRSPGRDKMPLLGDGNAGFFLSRSLSLGMPMLLGLENSFILERSLVFSCTGGAGAAA